MKTLPILYKKTNTGKIQTWQVGVDGNKVVTRFGQVGGKVQETYDIIKGKNLGKINETTDEEQAKVKAKQMWEKKIKDHYVASFEKADRGMSEVEGYKPMLAFPIEKKEKHVEFPAIAQPKLDGLRCLAVIENGNVTLFSRTGKPITTLPHIVKELANLFEDYECLRLDGELYNHDYKDDFNKIVSVIKRDEVHADHTLIQYHVYDAAMDGNYEQRYSPVATIIDSNGKYVCVVDYDVVNTKDDLDHYFSESLAAGYEGAMYRNVNMPYEHKRSAGLLKVKVMDDAEFKVTGVEEGNGKLMGKAGAFWCVTKDGKKFKAKMKGALENLTEYFVNFDKYKGKVLTVQYQGLTPDGVPRFPVGIRFREEE